MPHSFVSQSPDSFEWSAPAYCDRLRNDVTRPFPQERTEVNETSHSGEPRSDWQIRIALGATTSRYLSIPADSARPERNEAYRRWLKNGPCRFSARRLARLTHADRRAPAEITPRGPRFVREPIGKMSWPQ